MEIVTNTSWGYDSEGELDIQTVEKLSDRSEYHFRDCKSSKAREILFLIKKITSALSNQHTAKNYRAYLNSPFLEEEVKILQEFYGLANDLLLLFNVPLCWDYRTQALRKNSIEIEKARKALDESKDMFIYKRIENSGNISSDLLIDQ